MGREQRHLLLLCLACFVFLTRSSGYKICSYNVQNLNISKVSDTTVLHLLTKILSNCDVCLLQEVKDPDGEAMDRLISSLDRYNSYDDFSYNYVTSENLGPSGEEEQYVFLYRNETAALVETYQYPKSKKENVFSREPFIVHFKAPKTKIGEFVLIPLRVEPQNALKELDSLFDVLTEIKTKWNVENIMLLGDFHADCGYVTRKNRINNRLFSNRDLFWLIRDNADTTVTDMTDCAYDRFVVHGEKFLKAIEPQSARVFNFKKKFKISTDYVLKISDHYPIEVKLKEVKSAGQLQALMQPVLLILPLMVLFILPDSTTLLM
ncbi:deoxyribonuclease-1-like isoform X1 [Alosa alosa]|uniref:deoxyribonuclease-1-like isoform X1 n=1 Tax=Alosa alosa TaxID=278164 RepID=UPI0020153B60|nr:deoxyribonuclease-1-like isoform X1 [Alosa alosa]